MTVENEALRTMSGYKEKAGRWGGGGLKVHNEELRLQKSELSDVNNCELLTDPITEPKFRDISDSRSTGQGNFTVGVVSSLKGSSNTQLSWFSEITYFSLPPTRLFASERNAVDTI